MSKFDVNKIIQESLTEVNFGFIGEKIYDKLHPRDLNSPQEKALGAAERFRKASSEGNVEGTKKALRDLRRFLPQKKGPEEDLLRQETIRDAKRPARNALVYGSDEYKKLADQQEKAIAPDAIDKAIASDAAKKAAKQATQETNTPVLTKLTKSVGKIGDDVQSGVKSFGSKVADHLANLDYGKTALAAGLIGTGALALRRRSKKES